MFSSDKWFGAEASFYNGVISQSLRLSVGSNYKLDRQMVTPTSVTGTICTASWWMKKSAHGTVQSFIQCRDNQSSGNYSAYWTYDTGFGSYDHHAFRNEVDSLHIGVNTTVVPYRDSSAWYHVVIRYDSTQSTASDRIRIYKNGVLQNSTFATTTYPSQNHVDTYWNNPGEHLILFGNGEDSGDSFDGYIAEFNWVDGQSLPPETFGESKNGVWIPKKITLSTSDYGLNGSRYTFADSSDIGKDTSGVGNDLDRVSNLSSHDVVPDSPENNFCTASSDFRRAYRTQKQTGSEGNLKFTAPSTYNSIVQASMTINEIASEGGVYFEARVLSGGAGNNSYIGVVSIQDDLTSDTGPNTWPIKAVLDYLRGYFYKDGSSSDNYSSVTGIPYTTNDIIGIAINSDGKYFMHKNGTYFNQLASGSQQNPSTGSNEMVTLDLANYKYVPFVDGESAIHFNFGQDSTFGGAISSGGNTDANGIGDFAYAVPTNHLALCSANLPKPAIGPSSTTQAVNHFGTLAYTGDGNQTRTITSGATGIDGEIDFQPDWIAHKIRTGTAQGALNFDSTRGFEGAKAMDWSENTGEGTVVGANSAEYGYISGVGTNSFDVNDGTVSTNGGFVNYSGRTYVAWNWKANGGTTTTNNDGSIASTVQVNSTAGFSIVKATSPSSGTWTVGHGLGATPDFIIQKYLASSSRWTVWHNVLTSGQYLGLNENNGVASSGTPFNFTFNSTVIGGNANYDATSTDVIYYVFREVDGFSKFGQYTGNASTDGTFIHLGFRPAWFMVKAKTGTNNWIISDSVRSPTNVTGNWLYADGNFVEDTGSSRYLDFVSNGVKLRNGGTGTNSNGVIYLYMAFAEQPFKFANAR